MTIQQPQVPAFNSAAILAPNAYVQAAQAQRQQALAQMLMQQGAEMPAPNRMAGRYVVKTSPLEDLSHVVQTGLGAYIGNRAVTQGAQAQGDIARSQLANALIANGQDPSSVLGQQNAPRSPDAAPPMGGVASVPASDGGAGGTQPPEPIPPPEQPLPAAPASAPPAAVAQAPLPPPGADPADMAAAREQMAAQTAALPPAGSVPPPRAAPSMPMSPQAGAGPTSPTGQQLAQALIGRPPPGSVPMAPAQPQMAPQPMPQQTPQMAASPGGVTPQQMTARLLMPGGPQAILAQNLKNEAPTDQQKNAGAAFGLGSPAYVQNMQGIQAAAAAPKIEGSRPGDPIYRNGVQIGWVPDAANGLYFTTGPNGQPVPNRMQGATELAASRAGTVAGATAAATDANKQEPVKMADGSIMYLTAAQRSQMQGTPGAPVGPPGAAPPVVPTWAPSQGGAPSNIHAALRTEESGNVLDATGAMTSSNGGERAFGPMQVKPSTAAAPGFGIQPAQNSSPQEYERVGHQLLDALHQKYGNAPMAVASYAMGDGNFQNWLKGGANWNKLPQEAQNAVGKVLMLSATNPTGGAVAAPPSQGATQVPAPPTAPANAAASRLAPQISPFGVTPANQAVLEARGKAGAASANVDAATQNVVDGIDKLLAINDKVPSGVIGSAAVALGKMGAPGGIGREGAGYAQQWDQLAGHTVLNGIQSLPGQKDLPVQEEIVKTYGMDRSLPPAQRAQGLLNLRAMLLNNSSAAANTVVNLNNPNLTSNTVPRPMASAQSAGPGGIVPPVVAPTAGPESASAATLSPPIQSAARTPIAAGRPQLPPGLPAGSLYSAARNQFRTPDGRIFNADGTPAR